MGVKQLWTLLSPVGRPVLLETMEGKSMAIDSSIWIYQFQATMRDKDGRALVNAHILGFLRRICKLLFYGIKPVFVFDGGAPTLKKHTIAERKRKKAGAADSHAKIAQKLLAARMRREALSEVQKGKQTATTEVTTVYLEDLLANPATATPSKHKESTTPESMRGKSKFRDYDPYRLPELDLAAVSRPTTSFIPDPRLATEEELRQFIDAMRPEDFDVSSPAFRELPTEIQYEVIGDLRLKSRQTSHKRLETMLRNSKTPLDFSKAQITNLKQRNSLTQQLLLTTDTISKANVVIPVRIASERNKEYVLIKNEGAEGGWILGINDEGTRERPIEVDQLDKEPQSTDDSDDMEEVEVHKISTFGVSAHENHGRMASAAVKGRSSPKEEAIRSQIQIASVPLFLEDDFELDVAIQRSLIQQSEEESQALHYAIESPKKDGVHLQQDSMATTADVSDEDEDLYVSGPSRLETALAFANTLTHRADLQHSPSMFGTPVLLLDPELTSPAHGEEEQLPRECVSSGPLISTLIRQFEKSESHTDGGDADIEKAPLRGSSSVAQSAQSLVTHSNISEAAIATKQSFFVDGAPSIAEAPPFSGDIYEHTENSPTPDAFKQAQLMSVSMSAMINNEAANLNRVQNEQNSVISPKISATETVFTMKSDPVGRPSEKEADRLSDDERSASDWERSSSPSFGTAQKQKDMSQNEIDDAWDAAQEMDIVAEEGDFAEFVSQMKNQDLETARREVDEEIKELNKQRKAAMRDSEDVSQHMVSQIMLMLRLFGIPYITAPMEAEAQCAELVSLGLVEGIITDDSDVFLFGGSRVYKNMFNQSKTVECFFLNDLTRELGLDRDKLIRLAYLLGSDYVEGLPGVGPVVAMELLKEFPEDDGLHKFKVWWERVQSGKDTTTETDTKFKMRFKKRFKDLYLPEEWPNPAVRDAYYHPTVDESEEAFKWGIPDLHALHQFFHDELSWSQAKVDQLLVPIIRKIGQRNQSNAVNKQGTLNNYFETSFGSGISAPRRRQAYSSKRLQQVVTDFRAAQKSAGIATRDETSTSTPTEIKVKLAGKQGTLAQNGEKNKKGAPNRLGKRRRKAVSADEQSEAEQVEVTDNPMSVSADADIPKFAAAAAKLRPRPKQRHKGHLSDNGGENDDSSDDLFTVKRKRK
ncbi:hypothetical protein Clacol_002804 [Clathrus columnatus]|uniref:PIN domain-like protein n=1 Tax=Clathrus columnatus TaxID=1419009 RepID=A0AAV5A6J4_9AGAM|nr:hypothetical protein Clacol_002804 [Clathrus columnatus]